MSLGRALLGVIMLSVAGLGISTYLAWAYLIDVAPICGLNGGCEAVQHSLFASVAGVPVPVLGAVGYSGILAVAILALKWAERRDVLLPVLLGVALAGVLFSGYLTYVELFVIRAVCKWCVASAVVMLVLFGLVVAGYRSHE